MVGTGKNVWQAEIDAACETLDFLRFIPTAAHAVLSSQPPLHSRGAYNRLEHRPLEGFVAAITPFNFNAIGLNLAASPVFMGNAALWKPSSSSILGNFMAFRALERAGLPPGIINFLPCADGAAFGAAVLASPHLAGVHFTGSSATFERLWGDVAANLRAYRNYPRVVGEVWILLLL